MHDYFPSDAINHSKYVANNDTCHNSNQTQNKMSLHAIDAKKTQRNTPHRKTPNYAHTITATLAGLNNPILIYNYVAESPTG